MTLGGRESFTRCDVVEVLRPYANPMEMARLAYRYRKSGPGDRHPGCLDDIEEGLRQKAYDLITSLCKNGTIVRLGGGVYRYAQLEKDDNE